jgi:transketolase
VICHTVKGRGCALTERNLSWHHKGKLTDEQIDALRRGIEQGLMRQTCLAQVHRTGAAMRVWCSSDLTWGRNARRLPPGVPDRFFMEGVSEAEHHRDGCRPGARGFIPYVNTIATFLTRRCYEQTALDVCLHQLPVRLIGNGGGLVYAPLGPTHEAIEDIAIMRALPHMTVVAPADAAEMKRVMPLTLDWPGPIYVRLAKGGDQVVTDTLPVVGLDGAVLARDGNAALLVTTGVGLQIALKAATHLSSIGLEVRVLHFPTVKPLDTERLLAAATGMPAVVTIEEHSIIGGLGSAVAETLLERGLNPLPAFRRVGLPDVFADQYGSQATLMTRYGITPEAVAEIVQSLSGARHALR